ncbi:hypothetical protein KO494_03925 [Lacinutrix sp. C3R15]|uniref:hypothetical protein n=1 Tax=Flavobacteriaceae TaxID=49546 RepID=UPI001C080D88|nr:MULTISPECIES: hypothetical protein [Flavobacteriaceae]MBU2938683.1 hypothetical protein [Lacinutrix sp. C3R15]MDO6621997.1 hypothetical protein [Oceanihabitans sp. 1_MG-2023]
MKKLVLLYTGVLMTLTSVTAAEKITATQKQGEDLNNSRYSFIQPIQFVERGVEFLIFPDGSFDFNTNLDYTQGDAYYRTTNTRTNSRTNTRTRTVNTTFGAPGTRVTYTASSIPNPGVIVTHDSNGKVRRIGNVFVNYNREGQVKRLGSVYINYNRQGMLTQVGGLQIRYDRYGNVIAMTGHVNFSNQGHNVFNYDLHNDWDNNHNDYNNDDFYYYKKDGKTIKQEKLTRRTS